MAKGGMQREWERERMEDTMRRRKREGEGKDEKEKEGGRKEG